MSNNEYTPYRKFLAWVGFVTLFFVVPAVIAFVVVQANFYIDTAHASPLSSEERQAYNKVFVDCELVAAAKPTTQDIALQMHTCEEFNLHN
ncbi:MAG: hypothetical protein V4436_02055 [Patescibacteria group bacterium]